MGEEILSSDQRSVIEHAKFTFYPLGKALETKAKTIEDQGKMQIKPNEDHQQHLVESNELIKKDFNISGTKR